MTTRVPCCADVVTVAPRPFAQAGNSEIAGFSLAQLRVNVPLLSPGEMA